MRPSRWALYLIIGWGILGLFASAWPDFTIFWRWAGISLLSAGVLDGMLLFSRPKVVVERELPGRCALDVDSEVALTLRNPSRSAGAAITAFDGVPAVSECRELPWDGHIEARGFTTLIYPIKFLRRGLISFARTQILHHSPFRLWDRKYLAGPAEGEVRVYPNYEPVVRLALLSMENLENQMGIVRKNQHGLSRDFHQLRDYQEGDVLSQIDWKATSKRMTLISREYEEQRDQNIVLMVDSGRRMRAMDGELPQFDHCLNAMLLLSFVALKQGDNVGVMSFGGSNRWLPPVKGQHAMTTILNHLYDYDTTTKPSDFSEAAERLLVRQRRRALVVVLTNLRSEDSASLLPALELIRRKHLVLLASLREGSLDELLDEPVDDLEDALNFTATHLYLEERERMFDKIQATGVLALDEVALRLPIALANKYLDIKAMGRL